MVAPNQKARQGNNNRKALGDIGNVVELGTPNAISTKMW